MNEHQVVEVFAWLSLCVWLAVGVVNMVKYIMFIPNSDLDTPVDIETLKKILEGSTKSNHGD